MGTGNLLGQCKKKLLEVPFDGQVSHVGKAAMLLVFIFCRNELIARAVMEYTEEVVV